MRTLQQNVAVMTFNKKESDKDDSEEVTHWEDFVNEESPSSQLGTVNMINESVEG